MDDEYTEDAAHDHGDEVPEEAAPEPEPPDEADWAPDSSCPECGERHGHRVDPPCPNA